jgi:hypothetical protein
MQKQKLTWLWIAAILQLLTALVHSMSFFAKDVPANDTEKQLHELIMTYKKDLGLGFAPTFHDFLMALSAGFALLYLFGGLLGIYVIRKKSSPDFLKGFLNISILVYGINFIVAAYFTFIIPISFTCLVFIAVLIARFTLKAK